MNDLSHHELLIRSEDHLNALHRKENNEITQLCLIMFALHCVCIGANKRAENILISMNETLASATNALQHVLDNRVVLNHSKFNRIVEAIQPIYENSKEEHAQCVEVLSRLILSPNSAETLKALLTSVAQDLKLMKLEQELQHRVNRLRRDE